MKILICLLLLCYTTVLKAEYDKSDAVNYLTEGLKQEYQFDQKVKFFEKRAISYVRNNFSDTFAEFSGFILGTGSQILVKKQINFRGKTPLIGNRYELFISGDNLKLKLSGQAEIFENCQYWLSGESQEYGAGLLFSF